MSLRNYVRESLLKAATGGDVMLAEAKSVGDWWDRLPGKRRKKVVDILGMSKGKDNNQYGKLDTDEQSEISAYYKKHKGKVEGFDDYKGEPLSEGEGEWVGALLGNGGEKLITDLNKKIKRSPAKAMGIAVEILQDVNLHKEAEAVNKLLLKSSAYKKWGKRSK